jgi:hypothetical protein
VVSQTTFRYPVAFSVHCLNPFDGQGQLVGSCLTPKTIQGSFRLRAVKTRSHRKHDLSTFPWMLECLKCRCCSDPTKPMESKPVDCKFWGSGITLWTLQYPGVLIDLVDASQSALDKANEACRLSSLKESNIGTCYLKDNAKVEETTFQAHRSVE